MNFNTKGRRQKDEVRQNNLMRYEPRARPWPRRDEKKLMRKAHRRQEASSDVEDSGNRGRNRAA
jgi:hypothetical protein